MPKALRRLFKRRNKPESQAVGDGQSDTSTSPSSSNPQPKVFATGLKTLHSPENVIADIVFVHGLNGGQEKTWRAKGEKKSWPEKLLPSKLPDVRVLAFGYDAYVSHWKGLVSNNSVENHAKNLLSAVAQRREEDDTTDRPIFFIVHSLGGLVTMDALAWSNMSPEEHLKSILEFTRGIAFCGTPHLGSSLAPWARMLSISIGLIKQTNSEILGPLQKESEVLARILSTFHSLLEDRVSQSKSKIHITCFYEELPLPGIGYVVKKVSAILPAKTAIGLHGDHKTMVKFSSAEDPGFVSVIGELRRWIKQAEKEARLRNQAAETNLAMTSESPLSTIASLFEQLKWLDLRSKLYPNLDDISTESAKEQLAWLIHTRAYVAWMSPPRGEVLCSRWLWSSESSAGSLVFTESFAKYFGSLHMRTLHFDCNQYEESFSPFESLLSQYSKGVSPVLAVIMWTLIGQVFGADALDTEEVAIRIYERIGPYQSNPDHNGPDACFKMLCEVLRSALNFNPDTRFVILLRNIHVLDARNMIMLRNAVQEVMDSQRVEGVSETRAFITCQKNYATDSALKGAVPVDHRTEFQESLLYLRFRGMNIRRNKVLSVKLGAEHWLWSHATYQVWRRNDSGILWINGKPGSGKSVIARGITDRLIADSQIIRDIDKNPSTPPIVCAWFYSARDGLVSHRLMLRSLLEQILSQQNSLFDNIKSILRLDCNQEGDKSWSLNALQQALFTIASLPDRSGTILIVIDGLDESKENGDDSIELSRSSAISFLERLTISFKIILLSRYDSGIEQSLLRSHKIILQRENLPDVIRTVDEGMASLLKRLDSNGPVKAAQRLSQDHEGEAPVSESSRSAGHQPRKGKLRSFRKGAQVDQQTMVESFREYLIHNASGVILWVVTALSSLINRIAIYPSYKLKDLGTMLRHLPSDVDDLYADIVKSLEKGSHEAISFARRVLIWLNVGTSKRPFQLQELFEALKIPSSDDNDDEEDPFEHLPGVDSAWTFHQYIQRLCGPFVEVVQKDKGEDDPSLRPIEWTDHIQLIHQTVKTFLEDSDAARSFRMSYADAEQIVRQESLRYIHLSLPLREQAYSPFPVDPVRSWDDNVEGVLEYLEDKGLLSFILTVYPDAKEHVPDMYRFIFENSTSPSASRPLTPLLEQNSDYEIKYTTSPGNPTLNTIISHYFRLACEVGYRTAVENLFILASLRFSHEEQWKWYRDEAAILHGTLLIAIQKKLRLEVQKIAWYIRQRGIDLLDLPDKIVLGTQGQPLLVAAALESGDIDIASAVIGYRDAEEKEALLEFLRASLQSPKRALEDDDIEASRATIETTIGFWKAPRIHEYDNNSNLGSDFGPNLGANLGANPGANLGVNTCAIAYMSAMKDMFSQELKKQKMMQTTSTEQEFAQKMNDAAWRTLGEYNHRDLWLSHLELGRVVAVLHGARNAISVRLQSVDLGGHTSQNEIIVSLERSEPSHIVERSVQEGGFRQGRTYEVRRPYHPGSAASDKIQ